MSRLSSSEGAVSKIQIDDQFPTDSLCELCDLGNGLLAFAVLRNGSLQRLTGRLVVLHHDEPVSGIWPV